MKILDASRLAPVALFLLPTGPALAQIATVISPPVLANSNGSGDNDSDFSPALASNGGDVWTCVFVTNDSSLSNGGDQDIFYVQSRDLGLSWSAPLPIAPFFGIDTGITSVDIEPELACGGVGQMAVWASTHTSPTGFFGIYSSFSHPVNQSWVNALPVSTAFAGDAVDDRNPTVAGANGTFVTVWERDDTIGDRDLWFSRTTGSGGASWSAPARVDATSAIDTGTDLHPRIATDGAGHWVVVYSSPENHFGTGTDAEIYAYRSSNDGVTWVGPTLVNPTAASDSNAADTEPALAVDRASGTWICSWRTRNTFGGTTGSDAEIACSKSVDLGATWSSIVIVNRDFATDQSTSSDDTQPYISADQVGHILVSWTRTMMPANDTDLRAARSDDLGATWTSPQLIDIDAAGDAGADEHSQIVSNGRGHWITVWQSKDQVSPAIGPDLDVLVSHFMIPGADVGADFCYGYLEVGTHCPCGNDAVITAHSGCENSTGLGGRIITGGPFNVSAPTESIAFAQLPGGSAALIFQGSGQVAFRAGITFGDGRMCVGGILDRLGVAFANPIGEGALTFPPTNVSSGSTRFYQAWYRDSASFCTSATFNLTHAFGSVWVP